MRRDPSARDRAGLSLTETVVAVAVGAIVIGACAGALSFVARGHRRVDRRLTLTEVAQGVLEQLADDVAHADGEVRTPTEGIAAVGFAGDHDSFASLPRAGVHVINAFRQGVVAPHRSEVFAFLEIEPPERSRYLGPDPRPEIEIEPVAALRGLASVRVPTPSAPLPPGDRVGGRDGEELSPVGLLGDDPESVYLALSVGRGAAPERQVLWAFHRRSPGRRDRGRILRWSSDGTLRDLTARSPLLGDVRVVGQWIHVTTPSGHRGQEAIEGLVEVRLRSLQGARGGHTELFMRRTIVVGL